MERWFKCKSYFALDQQYTYTLIVMCRIGGGQPTFHEIWIRWEWITETPRTKNKIKNSILSHHCYSSLPFSPWEFSHIKGPLYTWKSFSLLLSLFASRFFLVEQISLQLQIEKVKSSIALFYNLGTNNTRVNR